MGRENHLVVKENSLPVLAFMLIFSGVTLHSQSFMDEPLAAQPTSKFR